MEFALAFRAPGVWIPTWQDVWARPKKVDYLSVLFVSPHLHVKIKINQQKYNYIPNLTHGKVWRNSFDLVFYLTLMKCFGDFLFEKKLMRVMRSATRKPGWASMQNRSLILFEAFLAYLRGKLPESFRVYASCVTFQWSLTDGPYKRSMWMMSMRVGKFQVLFSGALWCFLCAFSVIFSRKWL
jgi:hypothetical protein